MGFVFMPFKGTIDMVGKLEIKEKLVDVIIPR